jgi:hypothetical protein
VLDSSISGSGEDDDKCITQVLSFSNRLGQGEVYIRTGKGSSLDNLTFEKWSTLQRNVNVGEVGSLDDLKDNGIYSGVWLFGSLNNYPLTFVCVVINDYFIGTAPRRISQFVYGLSKFDGSVVYQSRVWDDSKDKWGDWEILNQKEISSMITKASSELTNYINSTVADAKRDILEGISAGTKDVSQKLTDIPEIEEQIKERLAKAGYTVHTGLGNANSRVSLAVFDEETDRYLVGVELDKDAYAASESALERDVFKPKFLESRGWTLMRVWSRDWWLSPQKVIKTICAAADKNMEKPITPKAEKPKRTKKKKESAE